jgi:hypothetical protein
MSRCRAGIYRGPADRYHEDQVDFVDTRTYRRGPAAHRLAVPYREHQRGRHAYRVIKPGDAHHVDGYSRTMRIEVR